MDDYISFATKGFLLRNCWMTSGSLHHINVLEHDTERGRVYVAVLLRSDRLTCFCVQTRKVWLYMILKELKQVYLHVYAFVVRVPTLLSQWSL